MKKSTHAARGLWGCFSVTLMEIKSFLILSSRIMTLLTALLSMSPGANCCSLNAPSSLTQPAENNGLVSVRIPGIRGSDGGNGGNGGIESVSGLESNSAWRLISRVEWKAREPESIEHFPGPIPYVILHHSFNPGVCLTEDACKASMRSMQNYHMDKHGWPDIGYSFAIGGDGNVYEGRGYNIIGAHAPPYNSRSIGLLLIGNFQDKLPPAPMMQRAKDFIRYSIDMGKLDENYVLYGHRQVRNTECPGGALFNEMKTWDHWKNLIRK